MTGKPSRVRRGAVLEGDERDGFAAEAGDALGEGGLVGEGGR